MFKLTLNKINDQVYQVRDASGAHVGNLKRIESRWKFKAIGYDELGDVIPGGGPLTDRHNTRFDSLDLDVLVAGLVRDE
jgi:hypothetical protein